MTVVMTDADIEKAIAEISQQMKAHLPNVERAWLHADRRDLRAELERRKLNALPGREDQTV